MAEPYKKITATVTKGECDVYKPGDQIIFVHGENMHGKICPFALNNLMPFFISMRFGAEFPEQTDKDVYTANACMDAEKMIIFEIKRS